MLDITAITPEIHRVVVPFLDIFTTVFVVRTPAGALLFDTATYPEDADNYPSPRLMSWASRQRNSNTSLSPMRTGIMQAALSASWSCVPTPASSRPTMD